jgi:hypothetical protein
MCTRRCFGEAYFAKGESLSRWKALRETLENPTKINTQTFNVQAENLESYYQNYSGTVQNIASFKKCTGSPIQIKLHQSMVDLIGKVDVLFYKYKLYPATINKNDNVEHTTVAILNFLFIAKALNESNRLEEAMKLIDVCSELLKMEKAIASILDNHESRFWNALWYGENFAQRLRRYTITNECEEEVKSASNAIDFTVINLAQALQHNCEHSIASRMRFLQLAPSIISLRAQDELAQAGQQTVELIATNFGSVIAAGQEPRSKMADIQARLQGVISAEHKQAEEPIRIGYAHLICFHPNTVIFVKAVIKAHPDILMQKNQPSIWEDEAPDELDCILDPNVQQLPRPLRLYLRHAQGVDHKNPAAIKKLVLQCDQINKKLIFAEPGSNDSQIIQLPTLYQSYEGLELFKEYSNRYDLLCGYYAAHAVKVFAANPHAPQQNFIDPLNDRNNFETQTLNPGELIIKQQRGDNEGDIADLRGDEIGSLLPQEILDRTIIIGSAAEDDILHNEEVVHRATQLTDRFITKQIDYLIYILPTNEHNHWVPVLARRVANQQVQLVITDSTGIDRRTISELRNIYQALATPEQLAIERPVAQQLEQLQQAQPVELRCEFDGYLEFTVSQETFDMLASKEDARRCENLAELHDARNIRDIYIRTIAGDSGRNCYFKLSTQQWSWLFDNISICINLVPNPDSQGNVCFYNVFSRPLVFKLSVEEHNVLSSYLNGKSCKEIFDGKNLVGWAVELPPKQCIKFPANCIKSLVLKTKTLH